MFVTMKSSVMIGVWTKNAEERMVTKSHHSFNTMQLSGVTDTGMSYFRLMQAQTYEEVQDLVLAKGTATYAAILGGKREGFARFLSDVLQTFETRLNELEASPSGQHWSGFPLSQEKVSQKMHALSPEQRKKFEAARAAMFPGLEHLYTR
nr:hypothetical protein B0A51_13524 [Rachicladosporium sp. CCFEE 5018]